MAGLLKFGFRGNAANAQRLGRLVFERLEFGCLVGWCATAEGLAAEVFLRQGERDLDVAVVRVERVDVCTALGFPANQLHGFQIELPPELWAPPANAQALTLCAAGVEVQVSLAGDLERWAAEVQALPDSFRKESALHGLIARLGRASDPKTLKPEAEVWVRLAAEERAWQSGLLDAATLPPAPVALRGGVESLDGPVVRGWVYAPGSGEEHISLRIQGQVVDCTVIRIQRPDAQHATGALRGALGFEIEVPGLVWQIPGVVEHCALEVLVNRQVLGSEPLVWSHQALRAEWVRVCTEEEALVVDQGRSINVHEHQYRLLLALEHLAASGLIRALSENEQQAAFKQAKRFGLEGLLRMESSSVQAGASVNSLTSPQRSASTLAAWEAQREFNRICVSGELPDSHTLEEFMARHGLSGEAKQGFLLSILPFFCGQGAYDRLRPYLAPFALRKLANAEDAWALSLVLPELVTQGDYKAARRVAQSLCKVATGWLNTECVAEAVRELLRQHASQATLEGSACRLVEELLVFVAIVGRDPWGRAHDRHLEAALISLLEAGALLPPALAEKLHRLVLRLHALQPCFWEALECAQPDEAAWPPALRDARLVFQRLKRALASEDGRELQAVWALLPSLVSLFKAGNSDAGQTLRELLLDLAARGLLNPGFASDAARLALDTLSASEPLRLAAHPLFAAQSLGAEWNARTRVRKITGVPHAPDAAVVSRLLQEFYAAKLPTLTLCRTLSGPENRHIGVFFAVWRWVSLGQDEASHMAELANLQELWDLATAGHPLEDPWPAPLLKAYSMLKRSLRRWADPQPSRLARHWEASLGAEAALLSYPDPAAIQLGASSPSAHTLVAVYSCRRHLDTRVRLIRESWGRTLTARGVPWVVVVGREGGAQAEFQSEFSAGRLSADGVVTLPVSDLYEDLPAKTLALVKWVHAHTDFDHVLKIDDDCHLAVDAFLESSPQLAAHYLGRRLQRAEGGTDRLWHQGKSSTARGAHAIDKSPEPSIYADGGAGYCLSRWAMGAILKQLETTVGARMTRSAFMEDKLVGDLLRQAHIELSSEGYETLVRRRTHPGAAPVNAYQNTFYPSRNSPTLVSHLDDAEDIPRVEAALQAGALAPGRIWPTYAPPVLGGVAGTNQLELLSGLAGLAGLASAPVILVAVARNEMLLMPHFLAHYRQLGVRHFVLIDNLSDDGTREYLLAQPDVVLYGADTEYRHSHYGVAWQQAVMGNHALGKWVVLADIDEFLVYENCESRSIVDWLAAIDAQGADAVLTLMVDMYPAGDLADADFRTQAPFEAAAFFDREPLIEWRLGSGHYSNGPTFLSALRHRLIAESAPNFFTSQKVAVFRYQPWVRCSEGLHYVTNVRAAPERAAFAHFKYHAGFKQKVLAEVARRQHFNGAEEYQKYLDLVAESAQPLFDAALSQRWEGSASMLSQLTSAGRPASDS